MSENLALLRKETTTLIQAIFDYCEMLESENNKLKMDLFLKDSEIKKLKEDYEELRKQVRNV